MCTAKAKKIFQSLFIYETPKLVEIKNWKIGVLHRVLEVVIAVYVVCWVLIYEKGYQVKEDVMSSVTAKLKGVMILNPSDSTEIPQIGDYADIAKPPLENNAFFVMTHQIQTKQQVSGRCPGILGVKGSACTSDANCSRMYPSVSEAGFRTGKCLTNFSNTGVCELFAWCPLENDTLVIKDAELRLEHISQYTVYVKNEIEYPEFRVKRSNRDALKSNRSLGSCRYDPEHKTDKYCPIMKLSTIFEKTGVSKRTILRGGVLGIVINWNCDLDCGIENCNPKYTFTNLETADKNSGFNYRYANYYRQNGTLYRDLIKVFGLRFSIFVHGEAGKFSIIPLFLNLGSGLALLGIAPTLCDIVILNLIGSRRFYKEAKFEVVEKQRTSSRSECVDAEPRPSRIRAKSMFSPKASTVNI